MENIDYNKEIDKLNEIKENIFETIKLQKWDELIKIIKTNDIDYNIKDSSNTYLLEYAIIFNREDIIRLLIEKNVRLDIVDENNKCILYNIIKFSYIPILELLLERDKETIGKSLLEIKDNDDNIALFYAIKFFNKECIKIILKNTINFYIKNIEGDNCLHLAIKSQNIDIYKIVSEYIKDIRARNNLGESYLHLMIKYKTYDMLDLFIDKNIENDFFLQILNSTDYKYNFTILHYACIYLDINIINILDKYKLLEKIDGNIQDISGNIFYHYYINNIIKSEKITIDEIKNITNLNNLFQKIKFNLNLYNIDGNTSGHLFFDNIEIFKKNKINVLINWITDNIDLNIQNFKGESVFFLIVKNGYWKEIKNILITKKIDIFIIIEKKNTIFDYLDKTDLDDFIDMITKSYLYQLTADDSIKWLDYWDNRCKKILYKNELNETEIELLKNLKVNLKDKNICYDIIHKKISNSITIFLENKNTFEMTSYPVANKFTKLIKNYPNVVISTFTGSSIDVMTGLIYLNNKFNMISTNFLSTSLEILNLNESLINCHNINDDPTKKICEVLGFEIVWKNKNLYLPSSKKGDLKSQLKSLIKYNRRNKYHFYIVPINIELVLTNTVYNHANYLIIDIKNMEAERFEPHGAYAPVDLNYFAELLDVELENQMNSINTKIKYFKPKDYMPKIGFQIKEISELKSDYIGDPNGFCALWCIWWADMRMENPNISRDKLFKLINKELINRKFSYKKLIRDYSSYITQVRDNIFIKADTNINEWINDTISQKNLEQLNINLVKEISNML
jgi:ankyrin repeat protein